MTTTNDVAVRNGHAPVQAAALAIQPGQVTWDKFQDAALAQIGLADAGNADKAVFLHQCQRTGLDPFSRQIYMIGRQERVPGSQNQWRTKWTIQTGIDGWRVIRDRAERREGVRGILSRFTYYDHEDNERKVWTRREPPAAVEVTYTVRDRNGVETPYTSILRHDEYVQTNKDGQPVAQWAVKDVHMLEKCTEADVYRKAFPQDFSGIHLDDAMPPADDAAPVQPQRPRITADAIRQRHHTVTAEVVTPDVPPAETATAAPHSPPPQQEDGTAGGTPARPALITSGQKDQIDKERQRLGYGEAAEDWDDWLADLAKLAGLAALAAPAELTQAEAKRVIDQLKPLDAKSLRRLLDTGEAAGGGQ